MATRADAGARTSRRCAGALLVALTAVAAGAAEPPGYGKVETFEPGKKYTCIPTADRKGWSCAETGKAPPAQSAAPPPAATPAPAPPPATPAARTGELPSYLTNAAAASRAPAAPSSHAPVAPPAPIPARSAPQPATTRTVAAPPPTAASAPARASAGGDFLDLPGEQFVIELAHAERADGLATARAAFAPSRGKVYELHLRQND